MNRFEQQGYYAASVEAPPLSPPLSESLRTDVCIVGGGFTGLACALELAERGRDVVLLEAEHVGWGASGRNGGQLIYGLCELDRVASRLGNDAARDFHRMGLECVDIVRDRVNRYRIECDLKPGYLAVATKSRHVDELRAAKAELEHYGYPQPLSLIDRQSLPQYVGSRRYLAGLYDPFSCHLQPLKLCLGEARAAVQQGVRLYERSRVLEVLPGTQPRVRTDSGEVLADAIVLAGNAYLGGLVPALSGRVLPAGSYMIATEPLGERAREILPRDIAVCDLNIALDYFRLSEGGRLLFGGLCNYSGRHPRDIAAVLKPNMLRVFPQLEDVAVEYQWGGYLGISLNRIPQLGRLPGNLWYAQGYSGHGLGTSHLAGRVLAEALCGDDQRLRGFERIRHFRLPGGPYLSNAALALGMLYFRLKDAF